MTERTIHRSTFVATVHVQVLRCVHRPRSRAASTDGQCARSLTRAVAGLARGGREWPIAAADVFRNRWRRRPTRRKNNEKLDARSGADEEFRYCGRGARRHRMKGVAPAGCRHVVVGGPSQMSDTFPSQILALFPRNHYRGHVTPVPNPNPNQRIDISVIFVN